METWGPVTVGLFAVLVAVWQLRASTQQFRANARDSHYSDIINGLGSPAAAVQTNSMRLLTEFVQDRSNYGGSTSDQEVGAVDAIQTLMAFIEDKSATRGFSGLHDYESPQPIVLSRAATQLVRLESNPDLGRHIADISRANLHGISLSGLAPTGNLIAEATDFRRATLAGLDLTHGFPDASPDLTYAFFTCGSLVGARMGTADLLGADLSGADLRGADLSQVQHLTGAQLHGVTVGPLTRFPTGLHGLLVRLRQHPGQSWGEATCHTEVDHMTGMQAGWGYLHTHPCPTETVQADAMTFSPAFDGNRSDLVLACRIRAGLPSTERSHSQPGERRSNAS